MQQNKKRKGDMAWVGGLWAGHTLYVAMTFFPASLNLWLPGSAFKIVLLLFVPDHITQALHSYISSIHTLGCSQEPKGERQLGFFLSPVVAQGEA